MSKKARTQTLDVFARHKSSGRKIAVLTAYDLTSALLGSAGGVDALLVGDSLGMVVLGYDNTLPVTLEEILHHCKAVTRARPEVPVIADMPYGSFHVSPEDTVRQALRLVKEGGVQAIKVEGGAARVATIEALLQAEIPVMGHLGLTPQSVNRLGGYKVQGRGDEAGARLLEEALLLEKTGCFSLVLECVPAPLAAEISTRLGIPTIGIGAGAGCDGQVLVFHDMLGLFDGLKPKFVKRYAELGEAGRAAIARYVAEVRSGEFPAAEHSYGDVAKTQGGQGTVAQSSVPDDKMTGDPDGPGYLADMENGKD